MRRINWCCSRQPTACYSRCCEWRSVTLKCAGDRSTNDWKLSEFFVWKIPILCACCIYLKVYPPYVGLFSIILPHR